MENEITTIESQRKMDSKTSSRKSGFITPNEAEALYGCKRLASRINELRKNFPRISTRLEFGRNRFGKTYEIRKVYLSFRL